MSVSFQIQGVEELAKMLEPRQLRGAVSEALDEMGREAKRDFERITKTWNHRVPIEVLKDVSRLELMVGTDDRIFGYLEHGTKAHAIRPKKARALRFMSGFHPKTTIGGLQSGAGGSYGDVVFSQGVWHPGTKARNWMPKIADRMRKRAKPIFGRYIERWAKK